MATHLPGVSIIATLTTDDDTATPEDVQAFTRYARAHEGIGGADSLLKLSDVGMQRLMDYDLGAILRVVAGNADQQRAALSALIEYIDTKRLDGTVYYDSTVRRGCMIAACAIGSGYVQTPTAVPWEKLDRRIGTVAHGEPMSLVTEIAFADLHYASDATGDDYTAEQKARIHANLRAVAVRRLAALGGGVA